MRGSLALEFKGPAHWAAASARSAAEREMSAVSRRSIAADPARPVFSHKSLPQSPGNDDRSHFRNSLGYLVKRNPRKKGVMDF